MPVTRRSFLGGSAAALAYGVIESSGPRLFASPLGLPIGLQLYSVREMLPTDFAGTLHKLGELGYREVEAAGFFGHSAADVKSAMADAGLRCVSAHYAWNDLHPKLAEIIDFHHKIGAEYIICSWPGSKDPSRPKTKANGGFNMDDWRWNADQFNAIGAQAKAAGLKFGYHNHVMEFPAQDGLVPYDELLRLTDPKLVTMEMDCGWVTVGGADPAAYLELYPIRISMLHVKDFKASDKPLNGNPNPVAAEMGKGVIDFPALFAAARHAEIKHIFVEQEEYDMPPFEALKIDADYMKSLKL